MEVILGLLVLGLLVALLITLATRPAAAPVALQFRWCPACQARREFNFQRCLHCGFRDDDLLRVQVEHCLRGQADAEFLAERKMLDAAAADSMRQFYINGLNAALAHSASQITPVHLLNRFNAAVAQASLAPAPSPRPAPLAESAQVPRPALAQPAVARNADESTEELPALPEAPPLPPEELTELRDAQPTPQAAQAFGGLPAAVPAPVRGDTEILRAPALAAPPLEPVEAVPTAERLTRLLLGLGVGGLAIAALVILTAHDGAPSPGKMLAFMAATAGIFAGGLAFSKWLKLERTAGAFYVLAALFLPLNGLAADVFGFATFDQPLLQWGGIALACALVYAGITFWLRSRVFAFLSGLTLTASCALLLEFLALRSVIPELLRDGTFALLPLAFVGACAAILRRTQGQWSLRLPGGESLLALVGGRLINERGREEAVRTPLDAAQVLSLPLVVNAHLAALVSLVWVLIHLSLHGRPALPSVGIAALALALFASALSFGRGLPRIMYATGVLALASSLAWLSYFSTGEHNGAFSLLAVAALLSGCEWLLARGRRGAFGEPLLHVALAVSVVAALLLMADYARLEVLRPVLRSQALAHTRGSLLTGAALLTALFGVWSLRERMAWAAPVSALGLFLLLLHGVDSLAMPAEALVGALVLVALAALLGALWSRETLGLWLGWTAVGFGAPVVLHVLARAAWPASTPELPYVAISALGGTAVALLAARQTRSLDLASVVGYLIAVGALAALRSLHVEQLPRGFSLALLVMGAGAALSQALGLPGRLEQRPLLHRAAASLTWGAAALVSLGLAIALAELAQANLAPAQAWPVNLALGCAAAVYLDFALRTRTPAWVAGSSLALAALAVSLPLQLELAWPHAALALSVLALAHAAILLAPLTRPWRLTLEACGATIGALAALGALAAASLPHEAWVPAAVALALVSLAAIAASQRRPLPWHALAAVISGAAAAVAAAHLGAGLDLLIAFAATAAVVSLAGSGLVAQGAALSGKTAALWSWTLRSLGEGASVLAGLFALKLAVDVRLEPAGLGKPALALALSSSSLAAGAFVSALRREEPLRAAQSVAAALFGWVAVAFALSHFGVDERWLGLALTPVSAALMGFGVVVRRRGYIEHGLSLIVVSTVLLCGGALLALVARSAGHDSSALTLAAVAASLLAAWRPARLDALAYLGCAALALAALFGMAHAQLEGPALLAGEAALAAALGAGSLLWKSRLDENPLSQSGAVLAAIVTVALLARGEALLGEGESGQALLVLLTLGGQFAATAWLSRIREFSGAALFFAVLAWLLGLHRLGVEPLAAYLAGPALAFIGVGVVEAKFAPLLWPQQVPPNVKLVLGLTIFFAPLLLLSLDLDHGREVATVFVAAALLLAASVKLKLRALLAGSLAAALAGLLVTLAMVIPFSRMGFGWWIGIGSGLLILTGVALERRVNAWLRESAAQARRRFLQAFTGWK